VFIGIGIAFVSPLTFLNFKKPNQKANKPSTYCCLKRKSGQEAREGIAAGNELQPQAQPAAPEREVYGYYAPAATENGGAKSEQEAAARELYGYFSPTVSPRAGDGVVAPHPGGGGLRN